MTPLQLNQLAKRAPQVNLLELAILADIYRFPASRITDVAERLKLSLQTTHFHCRRLALGFADRSGLDLIQIRQCQQDRRARRMTLTQHGQAVIDVLQPIQKSQPAEQPQQTQLGDADDIAPSFK